MNKKKPTLSLIAPMYNEQEVIKLFFDKVELILTKNKIDFEIVCVNDGSIDDTWNILLDEYKTRPYLKLVNLSRNYGKEAALTAGIDRCIGKAIIPIDCDMQDPPELLVDMHKKWQEGFDVVLAKRIDRSLDSPIKRITSSTFYKLIEKISEVKIPANIGDFRLMDRKVITAFQRYPERSRFMKGIFASLGFKQYILEYARPERLAGTTSWNYWKLYALALDGIISFSSAPLKIWTYLGSIIAICSILYGSTLIFKTLWLGVDIPGYASLIVVVLFMSGLILLSLGLLGEYIARIFNEVKSRPIYIIQEEIGFDESD